MVTLRRRQKPWQNHGPDPAVVPVQRPSDSLGQGAGLAALSFLCVVAFVVLVDITDEV